MKYILAPGEGPCCIYSQGNSVERRWVDFQNAVDHYLENEEGDLKYLVYLGPHSDLRHEWDFNNHQPKKE